MAPLRIESSGLGTLMEGIEKGICGKTFPSEFSSLFNEGALSFSDLFLAMPLSSFSLPKGLGSDMDGNEIRFFDGSADPSLFVAGNGELCTDTLSDPPSAAAASFFSAKGFDSDTDGNENFFFSFLMSSSCGYCPAGCANGILVTSSSTFVDKLSFSAKMLGRAKRGFRFSSAADWSSRIGIFVVISGGTGSPVMTASSCFAAPPFRIVLATTTPPPRTDAAIPAPTMASTLDLLSAATSPNPNCGALTFGSLILSGTLISGRAGSLISGTETLGTSILGRDRVGSDDAAEAPAPPPPPPCTALFSGSDNSS
mmetsp:Transcript_29935/g.87422  ORF Transcript_29935/g.87422 Transcript_29935/m.87422 type:complete len:312 (-) Transcript_29935:501-1436(-)